MQNQDNPCNPYEDIIALPHPASKKHPRMSLENRAAQFSPFAALTGYNEQINDASHRRTDRRQLSGYALSRLEARLSRLKKHQNITLTYFSEDYGTDGMGGFAGGEYLTCPCEVLELIPPLKILRVKIRNKSVDISFCDITDIE